MSAPRTERSILAPDLAGAVAQAGVDPTLQGRALQVALRRAIATRRRYCSWGVDHALDLAVLRRQLRWITNYLHGGLEHGLDADEVAAALAELEHIDTEERAHRA